jgi:hypothetical protein
MVDDLARLCAFTMLVYTGNPKLIKGKHVRLNRDKVNKVAHVVSDALAEMNEVDFIEDRNTIRLEVRKILEELLNQEERIDQSARQKIESQKRTILEGSQEWDILYRKYYNEEVKKLGV